MAKKKIIDISTTHEEATQLDDDKIIKGFESPNGGLKPGDIVVNKPDDETGKKHKKDK